MRKVIEYLKSKGEPEYIDEATEKQSDFHGNFGGIGQDDSQDELLPEAKKVILQAGKGSASLLQRRLKIGDSRAARILDLLEAQGVIGPADGAKPREVLAAHSSQGIGEEIEVENDEVDEEQE